MQFIDANPDVKKIESEMRATGKINYLKGNDPKKNGTQIYLLMRRWFIKSYGMA